MKRKHWYRKGFTLVELLVVIAIIVALAGLSVPAILRQKKKADMVQATSNAKQIFMLLVDFDQDYGSFPDDKTAISVKNNTDTSLNLDAANSNGLLRQLIAAGYVQSEGIFFAKTSYTKKPDDVVTGTKALEDGEVGFGYLLNDTTNAMSTASNAGRPILLTPLAKGSSDGSFDMDPFDNKAVILRIDGSVQAQNIRQKDKKVIVGDGSKTILQSGDDTVWGSDTPTVKVPKPKS